MAFNPKNLIKMTPDSDFPADVLAGIGLVAVQWSYLEYLLAMLLGSIVRNLHAGDVVMASLSNFHSKSDILRGLAQNYIIEDEQKTKIEDIIDRFSKISKKRNKLFHCLWGFRLFDGNVIQIVKRPASAKGDERNLVKAENLRELANEIQSMAVEVQEVIQRYWTQQVQEQEPVV